MLYSTAAYVSYKFEREIQIQSNDLNSLAASIQEMLLGERFQRRTWSLIRCQWIGVVSFFLLLILTCVMAIS